MPQLTQEQKANIARSVGGVPLDEKRRIAAELGATEAPQAGRGASGSWSMTPEDLPAPIRLPLKGLAQIGKGATNVLHAPLDLAREAYSAVTANPADLAPEETTTYGLHGPLGLLTQRLLVQPQVEQARQAAEAPAKSEAFGHGLAAATPLVGPWAAHLGETVGEGRPLEALGEAATAGVLPRVARETKGYIERRPVRQGYTTLNMDTMKPEVPANAVKVEMGKRIPTDGSPGTVYAPHEASTLAARALGGDASLEVMQDLSSTFNRAFPDLIDAVQQNSHLRGPITTPELGGKAAQYARARVWSKSFAPALKEAGPIELSPIANRMIAKIPETYKLLDKAKADTIAKIYREKFVGKATDSTSFHKVVKEARDEISGVLGKNPFEKQAMLGTPEGQLAQAHYEVLRDHLYDHVKQRTDFDLRPIGDSYGALSQLEQEFLGMPGPRSLMEEIFSSYTFPTPRAVAARVGERVGKHMLSKPKLLGRAFAQYAKEFAENPTERAKVTQPFRGKARAPVAPPGMRAPSVEGGVMQERQMGGPTPTGRVRYTKPPGPPNPRPPKQ